MRAWLNVPARWVAAGLARERFAHPGLEAGNEALALRQQPTLGDHAGPGASLDQLHEPRILLPNLVVELEELRDPLVGRVGGEEIVEDATRSVRGEREDRPDGKIRPTGEDVDPGVRPDEVELAKGELGVAAAA